MSGRTWVWAAVMVPVALLVAAGVLLRLNRPPDQAALLKIFDRNQPALQCLLDKGPPETQSSVDAEESEALIQACSAEAFALRLRFSRGATFVTVYESRGELGQLSLGFAHLTEQQREQWVSHDSELYRLDGGWDVYVQR